MYKNVVDTTGQRAPINLLSDHHPVPKNYASATPPSTAASSSYTALNCAGSRHASCTTHSCRGGVRVVVVAVGVVADTLVVSSLSHSRWCSRCHCRDHGHSLAIQSSGGKGQHQNESARNPGSRSINDCADDHTKVPAYDDRELLDSDGTGITVSHAHGLDFGIVERKRPNGPFATPSSVLTIKHADGFPVVTFVKERTRTLNGSDPEFVVSYPRPCLYSSLH